MSSPVRIVGSVSLGHFRKAIGIGMGMALAMMVMLGTSPAIAQPTCSNIGNLGTNYHLFAGFPGANSVKWYCFNLLQPVGCGDYLDIYTDVSSSGNPTVSPPDTAIALYDAAGNLVVSDDNDGPVDFSALSFGCSGAPRTYPGNTFSFNGSDGATLNTATYYLAIAVAPATFGPTNWNVTSGPHTTGYVDLLIHHNPCVFSHTLDSSGGNPDDKGDLYWRALSGDKAAFNRGERIVNLSATANCEIAMSGQSPSDRVAISFTQGRRGCPTIPPGLNWVFNPSKGRWEAEVISDVTTFIAPDPPFGTTITIAQSPTRPVIGKIISQSTCPPSPTFPADSYFDQFLEITVEGFPSPEERMTLFNTEPIRLEAVVTEWPPINHTYTSINTVDFYEKEGGSPVVNFGNCVVQLGGIIPETVPTVSQWGIITTASLLLSAGMIIFRRS